MVRSIRRAAGAESRGSRRGSVRRMPWTLGHAVAQAMRKHRRGAGRLRPCMTQVHPVSRRAPPPLPLVSRCTPVEIRSHSNLDRRLSPLRKTYFHQISPSISSSYSTYLSYSTPEIMVIFFPTGMAAVGRLFAPVRQLSCAAQRRLDRVRREVLDELLEGLAHLLLDLLLLRRVRHRGRSSSAAPRRGAICAAVLSRNSGWRRRVLYEF